jgi:Arc/MetJ-type ribon-helix-helix transcriptional regulator
MSKKKDATVWSIPVPGSLDRAVEMAVELDSHSTKSDLIRDAVRRELERLGFKTAVPVVGAKPKG